MLNLPNVKDGIGNVNFPNISGSNGVIKNIAFDPSLRLTKTPTQVSVDFLLPGNNTHTGWSFSRSPLQGVMYNYYLMGSVPASELIFSVSNMTSQVTDPLTFSTPNGMLLYEKDSIVTGRCISIGASDDCLTSEVPTYHTFFTKKDLRLKGRTSSAFEATLKWKQKNSGDEVHMTLGPTISKNGTLLKDAHKTRLSPTVLLETQTLLTEHTTTGSNIISVPITLPENCKIKLAQIKTKNEVLSSSGLLVEYRTDQNSSVLFPSHSTTADSVDHNYFLNLIRVQTDTNDRIDITNLTPVSFTGGLVEVILTYETFVLG